MNRTDSNGTWLVQDDGTELLVDPSAEWIAAHPEPVLPDAPLDPFSALKASIEQRLTDPAVNSIAKVKAAVVAAFDDAL